jgi:hypothetical protein
MGAAAASLPARAADRFTYTMTREIHAVDVRSGAEMPFASERVGKDSRRSLGVTGRVAISRRMAMVEEGGQVFAFASVPEALATEPRDLDVLIDGPDGMKVRGSIRYDPAGSRRVARVFVIPELAAGPALVEIHARGVHVADWQEIVTEEVELSKNARLHFGYALDGGTGKSPAVEVVVEARPVGEGGKPSIVMSRKVAAGSTKWHDETEDVGDLAGRKVRFVFRSRPAGGDTTGGAPGVVWGAPTIEIDEKRRAYPIILLVSLDSLRTSSVGLYSAAPSRGGSRPFLDGLFGRPASATPFLDSYFGRRGAVMMQATAQSVTTLPSHLTLLTGLNPMSHGVVDETRSLGAGVVTLADALRSRGWHTAAFTEGGALAGELGSGRGFDVYDEGESADIDPASSDAIERAQEWLAGYSGAPLFLFVHTYATRPVHTGVDGRHPAVREAELERYAGQVRAADRALGALFESAEARIDENDALFLVTSGHGEEFFEHGAAGHGTQLFDEVTRVPLLLRGSRIEETGRHALSVGLVDVAPTILELAGARVPAVMQGRSFAPLVEEGRAVQSAPRFSEARRPVRLTASGQLRLWKPPAFAVRDGNRKVIWNGGNSFEAYDLSADPRELRNLVVKGKMPEWARRMVTSLKSYPSLAGRQARPGRKADLSPANRSRLESLGYAR